MGEIKLTRLNKILREFNISLDRAVEFLASNGHEIDARPVSYTHLTLPTILRV